MFLTPLLVLAACGGLELPTATPTPKPIPAADLTIVHTAHMEGEIEPCG